MMTTKKIETSIIVFACNRCGETARDSDSSLGKGSLILAIVQNLDSNSKHAGDLCPKCTRWLRDQLKWDLEE